MPPRKRAETRLVSADELLEEEDASPNGQNGVIEGVVAPVEAQGDQDVESILPNFGEYTFASGLTVDVGRLKTRSFLKLLKIVTRGAAGFLMEYRLDPGMDGGEFVQKLVALIVLSIPEAEDETIEFFRAMTTPQGYIQGIKLSPAEREINEDLGLRYNAALDDPELEDLFGLMECIVKQEAEDIQALGKRLVAMFTVATKAGQTKDLAKPASN